MAIVTPPPAAAGSDEDDDFAVGEGPATVFSVSAPKGTLEAFRKIVGKRGLSAALTAAMEREVRNRARDAYMEEFYREHGEFTDEEMAEVDAVFARAAEKDALWRAEHKR